MSLIDATIDTLTITDAEIAADWKLGMARALGKILAVSGNTINDPDMRAHLKVGRVDRCAIATVRNITETAHQEYEHETFQSYTTDLTRISGMATCECGLLNGRISYDIYVGDLIGRVANA